MTKSVFGRIARIASCALVAGAIWQLAGFGANAYAHGFGPPPLRVVGLQLETPSGRVVVLRGVNCASMEFTSDGEGHILTTVATAIDDWHANVIRLPLSQDRWFGKGPEQTDGGVAYRALVRQIVELVQHKNAYIILDLHWSDENVWGKNIGQHKLPDLNSIIFWKDFAKVYRNNPSVLFDLYNEPHDTTWDAWKNGATLTETDRRSGQAVTYQAVGMQQVLDTIRSTGAKNVCVCGGLNWAYDMTGYLHGYTLSDPTGNGVIYSNHFYTVKGDTVDQWLAEMAAVDKLIPVIVSEFGSTSFRPRPGGRPFTPPPGFVRRPRIDSYAWNAAVLQAATQNDWSWCAWDLHPAAGPTLISDWNYTPTPEFGALVRATLRGEPLPPHPVDTPLVAAPTPTATSSPTPTPTP